jgi:hypothetical protein
MPKLSKRKRQLKEIHGRKGDEVDNGQEYEEGDEESVDSQTQEQLPSSQQQQQLPASAASTQPMSTVGQRSSARQQSQKQGRASVAAVTTSSRGSNGEGRAESKAQGSQSQQSSQSSNEKIASDNKVWVQCNRCDKWRSLPMTVDPRTLPEVWTCELNMYDPARMSCEAPEEEYTKEEEQQDLPLKSFFKIWVKRLKSGDRAEARLSSSAVTRNKKRKLDTEWIQCSNPSCGKWRAISKGIESANLIKRLNKNKRFGGDTNWFCSMNSWDDTTASCAAPQEPIWNCRWNLIRAMNNAPDRTGSV